MCNTFYTYSIFLITLLHIEQNIEQSSLCCTIRSDQISRSFVSDSLWPHELQHARTPCPSPTPGVHSDSRPLSQWCHPAISSSGVPFSSCPQSLQHQSLFQWVNSSHKVAKVLEFQLQHHSFQRNAKAQVSVLSAHTFSFSSSTGIISERRGGLAPVLTFI